MVLGTLHIVGAILTMLLVAAVGIYAGREVKSADDFATSRRRANATLVAGTLMGTMISGASTIGTAQLAFQFGFAAWWWTLGVGLGLAVLGIGFARRLYESRTDTLPQYLVGTFGDGIGPSATIFTSLGTYLNLVGNMLAFVALFTSTFRIAPSVAGAIGVLLVLSYVAFGGVWGTGLAGVFKIVILYSAMLSCGVTAYLKAGGVSGLTATFPHAPWFSLFGRGLSVDAAAGFSVLLGVLCSQHCFQAIVSAKNLREARRGTLISALLTPPIGLCGIAVGLYMRATLPQTSSSEALPVFVLKLFPPFWAGVALATLLISIVGGLAGMTLGISTMLTKDLYQKYIRSKAGSSELLLVQRLSLLAVCLLAAINLNGALGSLILSWSFMSMALRACSVLFPLIGATFFARWVTPMSGVMAALLGPLTGVIWHVAQPKGIDPLYPGLLVSLFVLVTVSAITARTVGSARVEPVAIPETGRER